MERLKYGASKLMTPEEKIQHRKMLAKRWRDNNKDVVSQRNHMWFVRYKRTKPFLATCTICGAEFNAMRDYYKMCPVCRKERHDKHKKAIAERKARVKKKNAFYEKVIHYRQLGWTQVQIAKKLKIGQARVSYICLTRGIKRGQK